MLSLFHFILNVSQTNQTCRTCRPCHLQFRLAPQTTNNLLTLIGINIFRIRRRFPLVLKQMTLELLPFFRQQGSLSYQTAINNPMGIETHISQIRQPFQLPTLRTWRLWSMLTTFLLSPFIYPLPNSTLIASPSLDISAVCAHRAG